MPMKNTAEFICTLDLDGQQRKVSFEIDSAACNATQTTLTPTDTQGVYMAQIAGESVPVYIRTDGITRITISIRGYSYDATILRTEHQALFDVINSSPAAKNRTIRISTPMPGMLKSINVLDGDKVLKGDTLFTLEAMKMENAITTPIHGVVKHITATAGQACEKGVQLCVIEPA